MTGGLYVERVSITGYTVYKYVNVFMYVYTVIEVCTYIHICVCTYVCICTLYVCLTGAYIVSHKCICTYSTYVLAVCVYMHNTWHI